MDRVVLCLVIPPVTLSCIFITTKPVGRIKIGKIKYHIYIVGNSRSRPRVFDRDFYHIRLPCFSIKIFSIVPIPFVCLCYGLCNQYDRFAVKNFFITGLKSDEKGRLSTVLFHINEKKYWCIKERREIHVLGFIIIRCLHVCLLRGIIVLGKYW